MLTQMWVWTQSESLDRFLLLFSLYKQAVKRRVFSWTEGQQSVVLNETIVLL